MKYESTLYLPQRVSTCEIAGAVALCALHDLRVNLSGFGGFPHILVEDTGSEFKVTISIIGEQPIASSFALTKPEAFKAAKDFKSATSVHDPKIFKRVQDAMAKVVG